MYVLHDRLHPPHRWHPSPLAGEVARQRRTRGPHGVAVAGCGLRGVGWGGEVVFLLWRGRWVALALVAVALLALAYLQAADVGPVAGEGAPVRYETVTVVPGDTLWTIASHRYPDADAREMVSEIEQANGLSNPVIEPGQRLRLPVR